MNAPLRTAEHEDTLRVLWSFVSKFDQGRRGAATAVSALDDFQRDALRIARLHLGEHGWGYHADGKPHTPDFR